MKVATYTFETHGKFLPEYRFQDPDWWKLDPQPEYHSGTKHARHGCVDSPLEEEFKQLADKWYRETRKMSVADQIVMHPAYQKIIGMGKEALPFIFRELERTRGHWIWALHMICRKDHAVLGQNFREAVDSWLKWGREQGYL